MPAITDAIILPKVQIDIHSSVIGLLSKNKNPFMELSILSLYINFRIKRTEKKRKERMSGRLYIEALIEKLNN